MFRFVGSWYDVCKLQRPQEATASRLYVQTIPLLRLSLETVTICCVTMMRLLPTLAWMLPGRTSECVSIFAVFGWLGCCYNPALYLSPLHDRLEWCESDRNGRAEEG